MATTELELDTRQYGGVHDSTFSTTELWKITVFSLYYHHILKASKLGKIDSDETILEGNKVESSAICAHGNGSKILKLSMSGSAESSETTLRH